ncbi:MAG: FecR domain-containing protein [Reichenbachiella sp.]|uniref:FecR family protein n=1 Tax=Reichenbachiella sp. TaxID=2184521 RepID=UPI0032654392
MEYNEYTTEDFLKDEFFISSMINSDAEDFWKDWTNTSPANLSDYNLARQVILSLSYKDVKRPQKTDYERTLNNILALDNDLRQSTKKIPRQKILTLPNVFKVAASIALLIVSIWVWNQYQPGGGMNQQDQEIVLISKTAAHGQKTTVRLSDGSRVTLNSGGKITYEKGFSEKKRKIELTGEAYFEVAKDVDRPFVVSTRGICTTALGTSFNIRAFGDESDVIISLVTGRVSVGQKEGFDVMLNPGDQLKYNMEGNNVEQNQFDTTNILAWTKGIIVFENASMEKVIKELEKWYGVTFEFENNSNTQWKYSGKFENQSLNNVLENLSYSQKFHYDLNDKTVKLKF